MTLFWVGETLLPTLLCNSLVEVGAAPDWDQSVESVLSVWHPVYTAHHTPYLAGEMEEPEYCCHSWKPCLAYTGPSLCPVNGFFSSLAACPLPWILKWWGFFPALHGPRIGLPDVLCAVTERHGSGSPVSGCLGSPQGEGVPWGAGPEPLGR